MSEELSIENQPLTPEEVEEMNALGIVLPAAEQYRDGVGEAMSAYAAQINEAGNTVANELDSIEAEADTTEQQARTSIEEQGRKDALDMLRNS